MTYTARDRAFMVMMAAQAAERHRIPGAEFEHPKGVIVPGDEFMTKKLAEENYVPYCGPCVSFQRVRRVEDGFECPTCGNKSNWDLTKFNGNVDVQFEPEHIEAGEAAKAKMLKSKENPHPKDNSFTIQWPENNWPEDNGKKNTSYHDCGKCDQQFFGKKSRKYCKLCQEKVTQHVNQIARENQTPFHVGNRRDRRHG